MQRRKLFLGIALCALAPVSAMADKTVSGQWLADLGHDVKIEMDVLEDGYWTSRTIENDKVVAEMAGSYRQTNSNGRSGTLVFTPVQSKVSKEHGAAQVETDQFSIDDGGSVMRLVSSADNSPMVFRKQSH
jgi:hypothetical protein